MQDARNVIEPMQYPALRGADAEAAPEGEGERVGPSALERRVEELEAELEGKKLELGARIEAVRREAAEQGRSAIESDRQSLLARCAEQLSCALEEFGQERDRYLAGVEKEVVQLSLAIAARILHREAQMDPLLLSGAVRVALGQVAEGTQVQLRVPSASRDLWAEMLRLMPSLPLRPDLIEDAEMEASGCVLETKMGAVNLGIPAQLKEIERGFFDLLQHRGNSEQRGHSEAARS